MNKLLIALVLVIVGCSPEVNTDGNLTQGSYFKEFESYCHEMGGSIEVADDFYCSTEDEDISYTEFENDFTENQLN